MRNFAPLLFVVTPLTRNSFFRRFAALRTCLRLEGLAFAVHMVYLNCGGSRRGPGGYCCVLHRCGWECFGLLGMVVFMREFFIAICIVIHRVLYYVMYGFGIIMVDITLLGNMTVSGPEWPNCGYFLVFHGLCSEVR